MLNNLTQKIATASVLSLSALVVFSQSALAQKENFRVINQSRNSITRLDISESSSGVWIPVTGLGRLRSGYSTGISFNNPSPYVCLYDIRTVFSSGEVIENYQVNVCSGDYYLLYDR